MKIKSEFGILDIPGRRKSEQMLDRIKAGPVRVIIDAEIVGEWSGYDGTSQEFELRVMSVADVSKVEAAE